ncbi:MAG: TolC family protein [Spirochaetes bacterium]|nr:TolC family protein [Spirochaetota bacterium]
MIRGYFTTLPLIALHILLAGGTLNAQVATPSYTVDDLVRIALEKYEPVKAQEAKVRENSALGRHLGEWYNPEFSFSAGQKTADGASGREFGASVTQRISFPGKKGLLEEMALLEEGRARLSLDEMKLFLRYEVTRLAYEYAHNLQRKGHIGDRLKRLRLINAYMQGRIMISPQKRVERSIIQSRITLLEKEVHRIGTDMKSAFARLNLYTGIPVDALPEVKVKWFTAAPALNEPDLSARAVSAGFPVRIQREALKSAGREKALAERNAYPDIGVTVYYNDEKVTAQERSIGGGVSFPLPLFSRNRHAADMGAEKEKAEELRLKHLERSTAGQMKDLFARYGYASAMVRNFPVGATGELKEAMRYTDAEFRKGRVALTTYLDMDAQTHEMLEEIYRTQLDLVNVYTSILFLAADERPVEGDL